MASGVATPLERQFAQIPGVTQMTSSSGLGLATIVIQFDLNRNIEAAAQDVQTAINAAGGVLPKNLPTPPTFRKVNPADAPIMNLFVQSDAYPLTVVDDYTDNVLAQQLSQIPGIALGQYHGRAEAVGARAGRSGQDRLARAALEDVRAMLSTATVNSPKGIFDGAAQGFTIYDNDQLLRAEPYNDLLLAYRNGSPDQGPRHRGGGGRGGKYQDRGLALRPARRAAGHLQAARRQRHRDGGPGAQAMLPRLQAALPPGIDVDILIDRTGPIRASVRGREVHPHASPSSWWWR